MLNNKIITFSYDDGVTQDERLITLFNRYHVKATFNLNYALLGEKGTLIRNNRSVRHDKIKAKDVKNMYFGHEVASHTLHHPFLPNLSKDSIINEVERDRKCLSDIVEYEVCGFAYPGGGINYDSRVAQIIQENTNIKYARTTQCSDSFYLPNDMYKIYPTVYHLDFDKMMDLGRRFVEEQTDEKRLFYIWGHSYELDAWDMWDKFEEFLKLVSEREDIDYLTNKEAFGIGE